LILSRSNTDVDLPICEGHTVMCGCEWYHPTIRIGLCNERLNSCNKHTGKHHTNSQLTYNNV